MTDNIQEMVRKSMDKERKVIEQLAKYITERNIRDAYKGFTEGQVRNAIEANYRDYISYAADIYETIYKIEQEMNFNRFS